jgi:hypothetical protein
LGCGDWGWAPSPNPQSPIPNPQSPQSPKDKKINKKINKNTYFIIKIS